jgi:N-ethylmaleimide reductase
VEAIKALEAAGVAYLSIAEADWDNAPELPDAFRQAARNAFSGLIIYAGRYTAARGARLVESGLADLIAIGRPFIANPDLPKRIANDWPLNAVNPVTLYGGAEKGFTDYPAYADLQLNHTEEVL